MANLTTREQILNQAERLFAQRGYHGTSLREVARACEVRQSLVQYHFESKEALFRAVFERRTLPMNHDRLMRLDRIEEETGAGESFDATEVVKALTEPIVMLSRHGRGGARLYPQLIAQIINDPQEHARNISREFNDPVARATIRALRRAIPQLSEDDVAWCYIFAIGAMVSSISGTGRVQQLSKGRCDPNDVDRILHLLVLFVVGGMRAVADRTRRAIRSKAPKRSVHKRQREREAFI